MATLKANGHLFHSATRKNKRDGVIIMNERIMVKVRCGRELLDIWTVSRSRKSPHKFAILRSELQELERCQSRVLIEKTQLGEPPHSCSGQFPRRRLCPHAGLCPATPCGRHPMGSKKYMNMKHLETAFIVGRLHSYQGLRTNEERGADR